MLNAFELSTQWYRGSFLFALIIFRILLNFLHSLFIWCSLFSSISYQLFSYIKFQILFSNMFSKWMISSYQSSDSVAIIPKFEALFWPNWLLYLNSNRRNSRSVTDKLQDTYGQNCWSIKVGTSVHFDGSNRRQRSYNCLLVVHYSIQCNYR